MNGYSTRKRPPHEQPRPTTGIGSDMVGNIPRPGDEHPLNGKPWGTFGGTNTVRLEGIKTDYKPGDSCATVTWEFTTYQTDRGTPWYACDARKPSSIRLEESAEGQRLVISRHRDKSQSARTVRSRYTLVPAVPLFVKLAVALAALMAAVWFNIVALNS